MEKISNFINKDNLESLWNILIIMRNIHLWRVVLKKYFFKAQAININYLLRSSRSMIQQNEQLSDTNLLYKEAHTHYILVNY